MRELAGRTALVTGASHGLGSYIARALAAERMNLVLAARSVAELDALAADLRKTGVDALPVPIDLGHEPILAAVQLGLKSVGRNNQIR